MAAGEQKGEDGTTLPFVPKTPRAAPMSWTGSCERSSRASIHHRAECDAVFPLELHACKPLESSIGPNRGSDRAVVILAAGPKVGRSLVLNATEQPLAVVPARRAVVLVLKQKADIVASNGIVFHSERMEMPAPCVVRLRYFVKVPYRAQAALTRRAVFARDGWVCQYCGLTAENVDHVIPKSRGGEHVWENVVAACRRCNSRKENRFPEEVGLRLLREPYAPRDGLRLSLGRLEPEWEAFL
jgi:5-methylcytosine-specific restriction endonuclease McrA